MKKIMLVASTGGHLIELMQLEEIFTKYNYFILTEKTTMSKSVVKNQNKVGYLYYGARNYPFRYLFKFAANVLKSFYYFVKFRPNIIITTGAHTAVPVCYIGKLFCRKIVFIETMARVNSASLTGKLLHRISNVTLVQWEEMLDVYPGSIYGGRLF